MPARSHAEATLCESDVRAMVRLIGEVVASRQDHAGMKRQLMDALCRLIDADAWIWMLGRQVQPGEQPTYLSMAHEVGDPDAARIPAKRDRFSANAPASPHPPGPDPGVSACCESNLPVKIRISTSSVARMTLLRIIAYAPATR